MINYTLHSTQAKTLGGVGAILVLLSAVPTVGAILGIIGFVMILVAVKYIADDLGDRKIFGDMMKAVAVAIFGIAIGSIVVVGTILSAFQNGYFTTNFVPSSTVTTAQWITFGTEIGLGLLGAWVFFLVSAIFLRRSYTVIGSKLNVKMFHTAGTFYLIGAAAAIVGVGFLLIFVAEILTLVAFFSIPEAQQQQHFAVPAAAPPSA